MTVKTQDEGRQAAAMQLLPSRKELPIWSQRKQLVQLVQNNGTVVLVGETGSGKTTQAPQFVQMVLKPPGLVACTQPRRIAAITVAQRVAIERATRLGGEVGYSVRFDDNTSEETKVKYLTDGMLIREAVSDPYLRGYSIIFVDEAHERTVNTDVLLGLLKIAQQNRYDSKHPLKLVVMSATLEEEKMLSFFPSSKPAFIPGRQYPVEVFYTTKKQESYVKGAIDTVLQVHLEEADGGILVFLTGQEEIELVKKTLLDVGSTLSHPRNLELMPVAVYAALPAEEQTAAFAPLPKGTRKVVLATNIAETSVTIPGIRFVVDTGMVKARAYSAAKSMESLQVGPTSQAQCMQRCGRAGREAPGKCFRLFPEAFFKELPAAAVPEIQRSSLVAVVLQLKAIGIADVVGFDFLDPPPREMLKAALNTLYALQATDSSGALTETGRKMARLPVDPPLAAALLAAAELQCASDAVAVVALLSSDRVILTPASRESEAAAAQKEFRSPLGDHITLLRIMRVFEALPQKKRNAWCQRHFVSIKSLRHAERVQGQLQGHLQNMGIELKVDSDTEEFTSLRRALLKGMFHNAARRNSGKSGYRLYGSGQEVQLHPSSVLVATRPPCVVFSEVVLTSRAYAHVATVIDAAWLPEMVPRFFANCVQS